MMVMKFSQYSIRTSSLPASLQLSTQTESLINQNIQLYSMSKEMELISTYSDILPSTKSTADAGILSVNFVGIEGETKTNGAVKPTVASIEMEHEIVVATMATKTGQEKDVCYFYLESANWNLQEAIELMQNMDALK
mmetsp:Transcript_4622/g.6307  ORF Transcript_4622/g.6307 Transcript_4622/m.6307 type:complete len:137 (-) Transcript_4622:240-650(-)